MEGASAQDPGVGGDVQSLPAGVVRFDLRGVLLNWNPALLQMLGRAPGERPPPTFGDLLTPASRLLYQTGVLPLLLARGWVEESYLSLRMADGGQLPVLANLRRTGAVAGAADDATDHCVAVLLRMRDRKRLEDELLRARRTSEQVPGLICQLHWQGGQHFSLPYASDAIQALLGLTPGLVRHSARPLARLVVPADRRALFRSLRQSGRELSDWYQVFRVRVRGALRWIEGRAAPQRLTDGSLVWHAYLCDVTEHQAMEALALEKAVAERASQAKSEFLARVSHELRTPLNAVLGFAQLLRADPLLHLSDPQRSQLAHIESAGHRLLALVNDLLDLSRIESGDEAKPRIQACLLAPVLQESAGLAQVLADRVGVQLHWQAEPGLQVRADPRQLAQCLLNLVGNAIKYNHAGGRVDLRAWRDEAQQVHIDVQDTGPGISAEQQAHLFEPFNRLGAEYGPTQGSGLGLVITRGLVQRMGGSLSLHSVPGQGSCFTLCLKAAQGALPETAAAAAVLPLAVAGAPAAHAGAARQLLCVDDNPVNLLVMAAICAHRPGLRWHQAETGQAALDLALQQRPDLLLIDIHLPDMTGGELLARLRRLPGLAQVPAVAVSADAMPADIERALALGFQAYWTKPLDLQQTLRALDAWLAGQPMR